MQKTIYKVLVLFLIFQLPIFASLQLIKKGVNDSDTTLLVISGIHGNEPGSYFAASILATHYQIHSKNLWIVPNLNKASILANERGLNGDMNRKFATIHTHDKDFKAVKEVKKAILSKNVSLVLNLHDGHGFYRKEFKGNIFNPNAWGQTCVIDQCKLKEDQPFGNLNEIALTVKNNVNKKLLKSHHSFDVRNTNTKFEDEQMQLSLTYFAVTNNKPAFAIESSKNLSSLSQKVYYQLLAIEEFMKIMKISYTRDFKFNESTISKIIKNYGNVTINNNILINLSNIKKSLSYIPIKSNSNQFKFSHPLGNINKRNNIYNIYIGNKKIVALKPQYFKLDTKCPEEFKILDGGKARSIKKATNFVVNDDLKVIKQDGIRVNIIGFTKKGVVNESGLVIRKASLNKKFSIDKKNTTFRIEFYKNKKFCSMSLVRFK